MSDHINSITHASSTSPDPDNAQIDDFLRTDGGSNEPTDTKDGETVQATHDDGYVEHSTASDRLNHNDGATDVNYDNDEYYEY